MKKLLIPVMTVLFMTSGFCQKSVTMEHVQEQLAKAKPYTLVFLTTGKKEAATNDEAAQKNQMLHLQYLFSLKENDVVSIFGPLTDDTRIRGILIFNLTDQDEIKKYLDADPHVKEGYLNYEIHPWFGVPGQSLAEK